MNKYNPREYWSQRARNEGRKYVAYKNRDSAFSKQQSVFSCELAMCLPRGGRLLDFGCGVGRFAPMASKLVNEYEGVDITKEALGYVPEIPGCRFTHLDSDTLPFPDGHFDGAMAITVVQHIVDPEDFELWTAELGRVIRPGGYFFGIDTPQPKKRVKRGFHMMWRTAEEIAEAIGAEVEFCHNVTAEFEGSHYAFVARKRDGLS